MGKSWGYPRPGSTGNRRKPSHTRIPLFHAHPPWQAEFPFVSFEWLFDPFTVMPIQMFNWVSRPQEEFHVNAAAAGLILLAMSLAMNAVAIVIRARFRKRIHW